jgi:lipopolysaccharide/colanic/teichoic acid biosynthesis glycosyltransferase
MLNRGALEGRRAGTPGSVHAFAKRALDLLVAVPALVILTPCLLLIALAVKLECPSAPAFFTQDRCGRGGTRFRLLKFRTMVPDAALRRDELREMSAVAWPDFRVIDDPRVTRLGRFLRKTSIDELPQLWNVVRGQMSLVGPRPTSFAADTYDLWQTERLEFKPGLTGPWQVIGRDTMDFTERCRLEISFFRQPSLRREVTILARTLPALVRRPGVA